MKTFQESVIYQIYVKSFQDSNGDGIGDLPGIISRLDYLSGLGVDYLWLTPVYLSPQRDNGYDVADYRAIDPRYGTMADMEELIQKAAARGIGIMLDMVFNHTSTEHVWFQKAIAGDPTYQDFYIWKDATPDGPPPTNWVSKFGGSTWEYVPAVGKAYLHLFDVTQADLNWENPAVRRELVDVLKFWIDKGVKGFRFDVVNLISKPAVFEDDLEGDGRRFYTDGPNVHAYLHELCEQSGILEKGMLTVGEMSSTDIESCVRYSNPNFGELDMCFNFHHLKVDYLDDNKWALAPCDFDRLKELLHCWQTEMQAGGGWNTLFWCNHDQPRVVSRFGNDQNEDLRIRSAKMLAMLVHFMRGTPYIFQGEEIGMTNANFHRIDQYVDVESINYYHILKEQNQPEQLIYQVLAARSRDNARTPMQWDATAQAGFTDQTPWLAVNPNHTYINVAHSLEEPDGIFAWYQALIRLRKELPVIATGSYEPMLADHPSVFAYRRRHGGEELVVLCNFYEVEAPMPLPAEQLTGFELLLGNYESKPGQTTLRPFECLALLRKHP